MKKFILRARDTQALYSRAFLTVICFMLSSCFAAKSQVDEDYLHCNLSTKTWFLETEGSLDGVNITAHTCNLPAECLVGFLFSGGFIVISSFIVSGSIVATGNAIHWLEKQGKCDEETLEDSITAHSETFAEKGKPIRTKHELLDFLHVEGLLTTPLPEDTSDI